MIPVRPTPPQWAEESVPRYVSPWYRRKQERTVAMARAGTPLEDICKAEALDKETVFAWCEARGVPHPKPRSRAGLKPEKHTDKAARLMDLGWSDQEIAKALGRRSTVIAVWRARRARGEPLKDSNTRNLKRHAQ